jgi:hypothetical protein
MNSNEEKEFYKELCVVAIVYTHAITSEQARAIFRYVKDYKLDDVKKALDEHVKSSKFFPTPADIIEKIPKKSATTWLLESDGFRYRTLSDGTKRRLLS